MATLTDAPVRELLEQPNFAVISTLNQDGSIHSTIVWISLEDDQHVAVNSAAGRVWPNNLERDARATIVAFETGNALRFVEIRGTATASREDAIAHANALAKKYIGQDEYPLAPGEERVRFTISADHVRYVDLNS